MPGEEPEAIALLRKIHDLLELLAEDKIAQRDSKQRSVLRQLAGASSVKQRSILLMDGNRTQAEILRVTSGNQGNLSTLVSALQKAGLLIGDTKTPSLTIAIPSNFFEITSERLEPS